MATAVLALAGGAAARAQVPVEDWSGMFEIANAHWEIDGGDVSVDARRNSDAGRLSLYIDWSRCDSVTGEVTSVYAYNSVRVVEPALVWFDPFMRSASARGRVLLDVHVSKYATCSTSGSPTSSTTFEDVPVKVIAKWTGRREHDGGPILVADDPLSCLVVGYHLEQGPQPWWDASATAQVEGSLPVVGDISGAYQPSSAGLQRYVQVAEKVALGECGWPES